MRVFKDNSNPLEEVALGDLVENVIYITEEGHRVRYIEKDNSLDILQTSWLNLGEKVYNLEVGEKPKALGLYWTIMNNKAREKDESTK